MTAANPINLTPLRNPNLLIKRGIWAYFLLLLFEGAIRKWLLPGLATPLLVVRDPLVLWILYLAWRRNLIVPNIYLAGMVYLGILSTIMALWVGHGNVQVALYGARALLLHFPLIFVISKVFNRHDIVKIGRVCLWISIPMAILITLQFYSPQNAWVNRGLNEEAEGGGFSGALGFFRPPGTFSFTNGNTLFFSFLACYIFYFWLNRENTNRILLLLATIALLVAIPFSISRTLLFNVIICILFAVIAVCFNPRYSLQMVKITLASFVFILILSTQNFFQIATEAFTTRFEDASQFEGGVKGTFTDRFLGEFTQPFDRILEKPYFGYGIGMGTNAGSQLLTGEREFLIAEGEWGRVVGEMGLVAGLGVILIRLALGVEIIINSIKKLLKGDILPWMLLSTGLVIMAQGGWAQPTSLGFYTIYGGFLLASFNKTKRFRLMKRTLQTEEISTSTPLTIQSAT